jgi:Uma2 family endonuclease
MGSSTSYQEAFYKEKAPRKISIEAFLRKYRKGGPGVKYEYNDGIIEKTDAMRFSEQYIANNLLNFFETTPSHKTGNKLVQELEVWTSDIKWRKPDLCLTTPQQVADAAKGANPVPLFVVEVISKNDKAKDIKNKTKEYLNAGVQVIWLLYPDAQSVEIYRPNTQNIEECSGDQICSAEPVVEGFKIKAEDVFKLP